MHLSSTMSPAEGILGGDGWLPTVLMLAMTVSLIVAIIWCTMCDTMVRTFVRPQPTVTPPNVDYNRIRAICKMPLKYASDLFSAKPKQTMRSTSQVKKKWPTVKKNPDEESEEQEIGGCFGWIKFHVVFNEVAGRLKVNIQNAMSLPVCDIIGSSDPFVMVILYPLNEKRCTSTISKNLNPVWKETLMFSIHKEALLNQTLYMFVLDNDWLSKDDLIGETSLRFLDEEKIFTGGQLYWHQFEPSIGPVGDFGELEFSLHYSVGENHLTVNVLRAMDLQAMDDISKSSDPYVKVDLLHKGKRVGKFKTPVVKSCLNPTFRQKVSFKLTPKQVKKSCILLTVKDKDFIGKNDVIGCVMMGMRGGNLERAHWQEMLNEDKETRPRWHPLRRE